MDSSSSLLTAVIKSLTLSSTFGPTTQMKNAQYNGEHVHKFQGMLCTLGAIKSYCSFLKINLSLFVHLLYVVSTSELLLCISTHVILPDPPLAARFMPLYDVPCLPTVFPMLPALLGALDTPEVKPRS